MDKLIVITFTEEQHAVDALTSLRLLRDQGEMGFYDAGIVAKDKNGKLSMKQVTDKMVKEYMWGSLIGSFIGLLGGPAGVIAGSIAGGLTGATLDFIDVGVKKDFIDRVGQSLQVNNSAVVALAWEVSDAPLDHAMASIGGRVFRTGIKDEFEKQIETQVKSDQETETKLKAEFAQAETEVKTIIQQQIDGLHAKKEMLRKELDARNQRIEANIKAVTRKVSSVVGEMKTTLEQRIAQMRAKQDRQGKLQALLS
ncbi:MAG TPA: DUF1269 domain-containing protein [Nitrospira sp.]|nr:DUF1269 domain-containing protein [Nitrospira sp.]